MSCRRLLRASGVSLRILLTLILSLPTLMKSTENQNLLLIKRQIPKLSMKEEQKSKMLIQLTELLIKMKLLLKIK